MNITKQRIFHFILIIIGVAIFWYSGAVWVYIIASLILSLMLSPLNQLIRKVQIKGYGMTNGLAAAATMLVLVSVIILMMNIFVPVVTKEVHLLSNVQMDEFYDVIEPEIKSIRHVISGTKLDALGEESEKDVIKKMLLGKKNLDRVPNFFSGLASGIGGSVIAIFSVLFISFFLLKDDDLFNGFVQSLSGDRNFDQVKSVLKKVKITLTRYFIGIVVQVSVISFFVFAGLSLFGFENALVIGLFAGFMNVIPYVGSLIGLAFGLLIGISTNIELATLESFWQIFGEILLVFGISQGIDNFITQPIVFSKSISAHPLEIFLVILIAGNISGIPGMIIAVPLYSVIRIIAKEYYIDSKFVRFMTQTMK